MKSTREHYHHGNLRAALLDAGLELAREGGPDAVIVREASRRVGVSHNASYRHFADRDRLLEAVCERCMAALARLMEAGIAEVDPEDRSVDAARRRLRATGSAYVEFALAEPGWFRTAFAVPPGLDYLTDGHGDGDGVGLGEGVGDGVGGGDGGDVGLGEGEGEGDGEGAGAGGLGPFQLLKVQLDALAVAGGLAAERRPHSEIVAWAAVHGFATLLLDGPLRDLPEGERKLALARLLDTVERGL